MKWFRVAWSLFVVCNPSWILQNGDAGIQDLFRAFIAFGRAIGPDNLAVWFVNTKYPLFEGPTLESTDIERMSKYCSKFGLIPSTTPQVITVINYPDDNDVGGQFVTNLNGDALDSARALTELTDELLETGLDQSTLDESYWHSIAIAASSAMKHASCYLNKVSFSIKTGVFNAEITHDVAGKC
jgi:hypothetical protein